MAVLCGNVFWMLVFAAVAAAVSAILGGVVSLLTRRQGKSKIRTIATITTFTIVLSYLIYYFTSFNGYRGLGDRYRIPIQYPYQISIYGASLAEGCLDRWEQSDSTILCGITDYAIQGTIMAGKRGETWRDLSGQWYSFDNSTGERIDAEQWFTFTFDGSELVYYPSEQAFVDACKELGFAKKPALVSMREHLED
jgi:hypothetical protein